MVDFPTFVNIIRTTTFSPFFMVERWVRGKFRDRKTRGNILHVFQKGAPGGSLVCWERRGHRKTALTSWLFCECIVVWTDGIGDWFSHLHLPAAVVASLSPIIFDWSMWENAEQNDQYKSEIFRQTPSWIRCCYRHSLAVFLNFSSTQSLSREMFTVTK